MAMMPNQRTVTLKLPCGIACKLLLLLTATVQADPDRYHHYQPIHDLIKRQLDEHDKKVMPS